MNKKLIALPAMLLLAASCSSQPAQTTDSGSANQPSASQPTASTTGQSATSTKFTDQTYYKNAYLISGSALSSDAQTALTGFQMSKQTLSGGSVQITLKALEAGYHDQQYTLTAGQQLYFIEKFLGDDKTEQKEDNNLGDDTAVVVDSQGNVALGPNVWSK